MLDVHFPGVVVVAIGSPSCALYRHQVVESARKQEQRGLMESVALWCRVPPSRVCVKDSLFFL